MTVALGLQTQFVCAFSSIWCGPHISKHDYLRIYLHKNWVRNLVALLHISAKNATVLINVYSLQTLAVTAKSQSV